MEKNLEVVVSSLILNGDLSKLSNEQKVSYYKMYCERLGLDPFSKPFDIINLQGKQVLYCTRAGTQQLNKLHGVSHVILARETKADAGVYYVIAQAKLPNGRCTESIGAVNITNLKGEALANAIMKAETKSKRRSSLDLLGLGVLDESEVETISNAHKESLDIENEVLTIPNENELLAERKKSKKKKAEEKTETITEITNMFANKYNNAEDIKLVIESAETVNELKTLYLTNQGIVENNPDIKSAFTNHKNQLLNGK